MSNWLAGRRVVVTRPGEQAKELCRHLLALGAEPLEFPVIAIAPPEEGGKLDEAIARLESYDWAIFTSVNGVEHFWARLKGKEFRGKAAAIGPATAEALGRRGVRVQLMPAEYRAEAILDEIGDLAGQRVLLPRADIARPALADGLRAMGAQVDEVAAYHTIPANPSPEAFAALRAGVHLVIFTSSSTVRSFVKLTDGLDYGDPLIACIGPVTAATAGELGLRVDLVAKEYTINGLLDALKTLDERPTQ